MPYRLIVETMEGTVEQIVFADSKRKALKLADQLVHGARILKRTVMEIYNA